MGPGGAKARARCRMMELRSDEVVFPHARTFFYRTDPPHPDPAQRKANEEAGARAETALREHFASLDKIASVGEFLCGVRLRNLATGGQRRDAAELVRYSGCVRVRYGRADVHGLEGRV